MLVSVQLYDLSSSHSLQVLNGGLDVLARISSGPAECGPEV